MRTAAGAAMTDTRRIPRRTFLGVAGVVALSACKRKDVGSGAPALHEGTVARSPRGEDMVAQRPLGKTGVNVSMVGLGGYHLGNVSDEKEAARMVHAAIERGMTFMDNCWDYHDGKSEEWMGKALAQDGYRQKAFLMTKVDGRTKKAAADQLEESLRRLRTDTIDLVQLHEIIRDSDPERCFAPGGAIEAMIDAKRAGKLRFIGFTGHKDPSIHLAMLKAADAHGFAFDAVQMPLNVLDAHYRSFEKMVLPVLVQKGIGVLGMKPMSAGKIIETKKVTPIECLHYAMSLPTSVVITGCDSMEILEQAIVAATTYEPMPAEKVTALLDRTRELAMGGKLELFKTTTEHDGTVRHPEWLESA